MTRRNAAAVRRLPACRAAPSVFVGHHASSSSLPAWGVAPLVLPARSRTPRGGDAFSDGLPGQAVLTLPLPSADVCARLPPGLQLAATHAGHLDCRLQLLGVEATWPASTRGAGSSTSACAAQHSHQPGVVSATSAAAGFACRSSALLLAHVLFPDHSHHMLSYLAVTVAVADGLAVVAATTPPAARQAVGRLKRRLQGQPRQQHGGDGSSSSMGWVDGVQGAVQGSLHTLRCLSGPAAALATAGWLWSLVSPSSHTLCSALVALLAVSAEYNGLGRDIAQGRVRPGKDTEAAWRARHKAAAQRLAEYCADLPATPPLAPLVRAAGLVSVAAGLAVDGQGLSGQLARGGSSGSAWCGGGAGRQQLLLAASVVAGGHDAGELHEVAGLSRAALQELFTGSSTEQPGAVPALTAQRQHSGSTPLAAAAAAAAAGAAALQAALAGSSALAAESPLDAAAAHTSVLTAGQVPWIVSAAASDADSDMSADAVIRVQQVAVENGSKPQQLHQARCAGSSSDGCSGCSSSSGCSPAAAGPAAAGAAAGAAAASAARAAVSVDDNPLDFLSGLPLYGQQDHSQALAAAATASSGTAVDPRLAARLSVAEALQLALRAAYLLLVFAPFLLLGVPMLLVASWLLSRAAAARQQHQVTPAPPAHEHDGSAAVGVAPGRRHVRHGMHVHARSSAAAISSSRSEAFAIPEQQQRWCAALQRSLRAPGRLLLQALRQALALLSMLLALLDLLLVLLLGGHWAAGLSAWESAGLHLHRQAWVLLRGGCAGAGAAMIKWAQWSASRRDIFPADFCDVLCMFHDRAPAHSYRHTAQQVRAAFGADVEQLFDSFEATPLASGSIAQVHRATLAPARLQRYLQQRRRTQQQQAVVDLAGCAQAAAAAAERQEVVVKVCHPRVAHHIRLDFKLLAWLSAAAARLPALRGLSLRESVAQFSHTMTAQTDLRVEAVHALRFHTNFAGVRSSVSIPRPVPGLVSCNVLVEAYEPGDSVAQFMRQPAPINTHIVALGVDAFLKMLLIDNFVHTDLHPGNILFRSVPHASQQQQRHSRQPQQQPPQPRPALPRWQLWRRRQASSSNDIGLSPTDDAAPQAAAAPAPAQWELELERMIAQQQHSWHARHGVATTTPSGATAQVGANVAALMQLAGDGSSDGSSGGGAHSFAPPPPPSSAQLVLLDFGLAEQLTPTVRHHFVSFLNAISAGDGLAASRHLLRWSRRQACADRRAFAADVVDLFQAACDIHSPDGIDLDHVMKAVLALARKHGVSIDSCYASLVISVCVLVGFGKALDPAVNLMDAATPTLLAYSLTGKVVGRLYS